jgi:hypothetical protein
VKPTHARVLVTTLGGGSLLLAGACADREHIRDDFGVKARAFQQKQHVHAEATEGSPTGLDSEEAALIQAQYRKSLSGGASTDESGDVLVIEQPKAAAKGK